MRLEVKRFHWLRKIALAAMAMLASYGSLAEEPKASSLHLMPMPERIAKTQGSLAIDGTLTIHSSGFRDPSLTAAIDRALGRLRRKTGGSFSSSQNVDPVSGQTLFEIHCDGAGEQVPSVRTDESYVLQISSDGIHLNAPSPTGIFRGLETFLQLVDLDARSFFVPFVRIEDRPRFCWRGLLIDVVRHWEPPEVIQRNLDAMAALKMNVLHWHLSDDQGFRVESLVFPKLHEIGSEGNYYTQDEIREIVAYAGARGIRVVPEFDVPDHTTAWLAAYPELASAPGPYGIARAWVVPGPCLDPSSEKVYSFLDKFVGEMAGLFPDRYFHIGGDEVSGKDWSASAKIRDFKARLNLKDNRDLQAYFNRRLLEILEKHGKKMIGWDEILHADLQKDAVIQSWRGQASMAKIARRGHRGILSFGYYLDQMRPAAFHYGIDPLGGEAATLAEDEKQRILGGEACMWGEFVNPDNIESRIWPRTAAIAERLWSPAKVRDVRDMYRRLGFVDREMALSGLNHRSNYAAMLQRLAGNRESAPLKILADVLEPEGLSFRARTKKYSSLVPLNRMVDTILPESETAREFEDLVDQALSNPFPLREAFEEIRKHLSLWKINREQARPVIEESFLLKEIAPLNDSVFELSEKGLEALNYLQAQRKPPEAWRREAAGLLRQSAEPQAEMTVAIVPAIEKLVAAADAIP